MKFKKPIIVLITLSLFLVTGCIREMENEEQKIDIQKRIGDGNKYESFKEVTNNEEVQTVRNILNKADWKHGYGDMSRLADFRFVFQYKNPEIEAKAVLYEIWKGPNKDKVEILKDGNEFTQLNEKNSSVLVEILTDEHVMSIIH